MSIDQISHPRIMLKGLVFIGQVSLGILCLHGPDYRILIKDFSMVLHIGTEDVREKFIIVLPIIILTLIICSLAYLVIIKIAPWIIGKKKAVKSSKNAEK